MDPNERSFISRWYQYQKERFPFGRNSLFLSTFAFCAISYSRINRGAEGFVPWSLLICAAISTILFFFLLRLIDEFKDREYDAANRPHLPVPRGLVSFKEIRYTGIVSLILLVLVNVLLAPQMLVLLLIPIVFLGLIAADFFVPKWLNRHWPIYVATHMFFYPALDVYTSGMDWLPVGDVKAPVGMVFFFIVSYMNGLVYEVGRKIRAPENEESNSYTTMYGRINAMTLWFGCISIAYVIALLAARHIHLGWQGTALLSLLYGSSLLYGILFLRRPNVKMSRLVELSSGFWGLSMYLILGLLPFILRAFFGQ